jgi:hypothetical protein
VKVNDEEPDRRRDPVPAVWGSLWGSPTPKRAVFSVLKRIVAANEKEPKALD